MKSSLTNFEQRALFGSISAIVLALLLLVSHTTPFQYLFVLVIALFQAAALWEYYRLVRGKGFQPLSRIAITFSVVYIIFHFFALKCPHMAVYTEFLLFSFTLTTFISYFTRQKNSTANIATTIFGFIYVTFPLSLLLDLNYSLMKGRVETSPVWLFFLIVLTKATDTFAYFIGKRFGKRKIAPILSPKKTVEGTIGGVVFALIAGLIFYAVVAALGSSLTPELTLLEVGIISILIGIAGIMGDLAESLLKRDAALKDSNDIPGFGGILDMADSTLFTAPFLYIYLRAKLLI